MNIEQARRNMISQQLRAWGVLNNQVLDLFARLPRENFVPASYQSLAFADIAIPLNQNITTLAPREEAKIIQSLKIKSTDKALVLGTGNGYITALLANQAHWVYSIDDSKQFTETARQKLMDLGINNVTLETASAINGWEQAAPYDVIVITGSLAQIPKYLMRMLANYGRLFAITGAAPVMKAVCLTLDSGHWQAEELFETLRPRLPGAKELQTFTF